MGTPGSGSCCTAERLRGRGPRHQQRAHCGGRQRVFLHVKGRWLQGNTYGHKQFTGWSWEANCNVKRLAVGIASIKTTRTASMHCSLVTPALLPRVYGHRCHQALRGHCEGFTTCRITYALCHLNALMLCCVVLCCMVPRPTEQAVHTPQQSFNAFHLV